MSGKGKQQAFDGDIIKRESKRNEEVKSSVPTVSTEAPESLKDIITEE